MGPCFEGGLLTHYDGVNYKDSILGDHRIYFGLNGYSAGPCIMVQMIIRILTQSFRL